MRKHALSVIGYHSRSIVGLPESSRTSLLARRPPLGQQVHLALVESGASTARAIAEQAGQPDLFARVAAVAGEAPAPSFLHSALCAMSLPVRSPADQYAPIIRQDGQYTLVINPKPVVARVDGEQKLVSLGVPYGSLPRLILIHIMTEAVRTRSRNITFGVTFADWMRRMGFRTISYGPRGSATLIRDQFDRLLACEWMIRWDSSPATSGREFGIKEIKLTNEYAGFDRRSGAFMREICMTEGFYDHLREHAVPLNENAIRHIRNSATALDLNTWLAYRLPRLSPKKAATLSWQQLAVHFGNDGMNIRKFRQTIREAWERQVSAVYPEAKADFDTTLIRLHASPAPLQQKLVPGAQLHLATDGNGTANGETAVTTPPPEVAEEASVPARFLAVLTKIVGPADARAWLKEASLEQGEEGWVLFAKARLTADWIRSRFGTQLRQAANAVGLADTPDVQSRPAAN